MVKKTLAFIFILILVLTAIFYWHPNLFLFLALYPGIVAGLFFSNVHSGSHAQYNVGIAVGVVVNFLVYAAASSLFRRSRKSSK